MGGGAFTSSRSLYNHFLCPGLLWLQLLFKATDPQLLLWTITPAPPLRSSTSPSLSRILAAFCPRRTDHVICGQILYHWAITPPTRSRYLNPVFPCCLLCQGHCSPWCLCVSYARHMFICSFIHSLPIRYSLKLPMYYRHCSRPWGYKDFPSSGWQGLHPRL